MIFNECKNVLEAFRDYVIEFLLGVRGLSIAIIRIFPRPPTEAGDDETFIDGGKILEALDLTFSISRSG